jgi:tetratricopeptide (TPR) repeat protein
LEDISYFDEANIIYGKGNYKEALKMYKKAIKENCNSPSAFYNAGVCYIKLKEYSNALKSFIRTIELGDRRNKVYFNLGYCYLALEDAKKAYLSFNISYSLNNEDTECEKAIKMTESIICK